MPAQPIEVRAPLTLGAFLKLCGAAGTGGEAKLLVQQGAVAVNGSVEKRRGHAVGPGDEVTVAGCTYRLTAGSG